MGNSPSSSTPVSDFLKAPKIGEKIGVKALDHIADRHRGDIAGAFGHAVYGKKGAAAATALVGNNIYRPSGTSGPR